MALHRVARAARLLREPGRVPAAIVRRILPRHPRLGFTWVHLADGSVTFREAGFVSASSPALLLARHHYETARIATLLAGRPFEASLEVGCGYGRLTPTFARCSRQHTAIDINPDALAQARATYPAYDFRPGSATEIPFPDDSFDLVCTWTVIQHVPPDRIAQACAELLRVLRPGGCLLLCEETATPATTPARRHTWERSESEYGALLQPLRLADSGFIDEIDALPGMRSPGRVMLWVDDAAGA